MSEQLAIDSDNLVSWFDPTDELDETDINDATGSVTLKDSNGDNVAGAIGLTVAYLAGPPRRYYATIPSTVTLVEGSVYYAEFTLTDDDGTPIGFRRKQYTAEYAT
jgi:hypothetical protein